MKISSIAIATLSVLFLPPVEGSEYYVSTSGNDAALGTSPNQAWKTISKVESKMAQFTSEANNEDVTIYFDNDDIWLNDELDITCFGTSGNWITFDGTAWGGQPSGTSRAAIGRTSSSYRNSVHITYGNGTYSQDAYIVLQGFEIDGNGLVDNVLVRTLNANYVKILNNKIHDPVTGEGKYTPTVFLTTSPNVTGTIEIHHLTVSNNEIYGAGAHGIAFYPSTGSYLDDVGNITVTDNLIYNFGRSPSSSYASGVQVMSCVGGEISGNIIRDGYGSSDGFGIKLETRNRRCSDIDVHNNIIYGGSGIELCVGISVDGGQNIDLYNNIIRNISREAISWGGAIGGASGRILNNTIFKSGIVAIYLGSTSQIDAMHNNIIYQTDNVQAINRSDRITQHSNNNFYNTTSGRALVGSYTSDSISSWEPTVQTGAPGFVDAGTPPTGFDAYGKMSPRGLNITTLGAAYNKAVDLSTLFNNDIEGDIRPDPWDIGADEYVVAGPADTVAPTVSITAPADGAILSGTVELSASASDDTGVAGVQFKLDGANLGSEDTTSPYSIVWDTMGAADGSHTLTAVARDAAGNQKTSASIAVTVNNEPLADTEPPTKPANLNTFAASSSQVDLSWGASSDNVSVAGYRIFRDDLEIATSSTTTYSDSGLSESALYTYTVSAYDAAGNESALSQPVSATTLSADEMVSTSAWQNKSFELQSGPFDAEYDAVPDSANINAVTGLASGNAASYDDLAIIARFNDSGQIDVRNGDVYAADTVINYTAGTEYHFRIMADLSTHRYSVYAQTGAGPEILIAGDYAFRTSQSAVASLDTLAVNAEIGSHMVSGFSATAALPADTVAPTVSITAPADGAILSGTADLTASASDDTGVAGVQFKLDGANLGSEDATPPYFIVWDTTGAADGAHTLTAVARDAAGNTQTSASVIVTVYNEPPADTVAPTVSITAPADGAILSGTADLTASASDDTGVAGVQFKLDGANLGSEDATPPYFIVWDTTGAADGAHTLTAVARDAAGNSETSSAVDFTVNNEPPPGGAIISAINTWENQSFTAQNGSFTAGFNAVPDGAPIDAVTGLSSENAASYDDLAIIVRFNDSGQIDVRNGDVYTADAAINYTAGTEYHFRITVDLSTHRYSVYVQTGGGPETLVAGDYAFRTSQSAVASLDTLAVTAEIGSHMASGFSATPMVTPVAPEELLPTDVEMY